MIQSKITSKVLLVLSVILTVIAIAGTVAFLIHFSKGGVYVEAELLPSEIVTSLVFGYINLLFASFCFAQYLLVGGNGNGRTMDIARMVLLFFGYSAFLLSILAAIFVCYSFIGRDFLTLRIFLAFIFPFMLGMLCVGFSSELDRAKMKIICP